jgi:hypothetical protein
MGRSRFWGVSHNDGIRVDFGDFTYLDTFGAFVVTGFVGCIAIDAANWRVCAGRAFLADWESARVILGFVGICTYSAAGDVLA